MSTEPKAFWLSPVEYNIVVLPDEVENTTRGGIILPPKAHETDQLAIMLGTLLAASPLAFNYDTWPEDRIGERPRVGDRILYAKYAGTVVKSPDGTEVRICKDKDCIAVIHQEQANG